MAREEKVWEYAMDAGFTPLEDRCIIVKGAAGELTLVVQCIELHALGEAEDLQG